MPRFKPSFQFIHFLQIYFLKQTDAKFIIAAQQYKYIFINCLQLKIYASAVMKFVQDKIEANLLFKIM